MSDEARQAVEPLRHEREPANYTPNVVPLIDVLFLLLLFFLLGTQLRQTEGDIPGCLAGGSVDTREPKIDLQPVQVTVRSQGAMNEGAYYEIQGLPQVISGPEQLYRALQQRHGQLAASGMRVSLKPTPGARWRYVVEAQNQAVRAGCKSVLFDTSF
jgi:biopolymer transport protein ExbD